MVYHSEVFGPRVSGSGSSLGGGNAMIVDWHWALLSRLTSNTGRKEMLAMVHQFKGVLMKDPWMEFPCHSLRRIFGALRKVGNIAEQMFPEFS